MGLVALYMVVNEKVVSAIIRQTETPLLKFGMGDPSVEAEKCKEIQAFVACYGLAGASILKQDLIADENHYPYSEKDMKRPLTYFSNKCYVNISLFHSDHVKAATEAATQAATEAASAAASAATSTTTNTSSWYNYFWGTNRPQ